MDTNRLLFTEIDESASISQPSSKVGFAVVKASKGSIEPMYFPRNSTEAIKSRIGEPTNVYPGIREVIEFNKSYNIWVSAPPGDAVNLMVNGVKVTDDDGNDVFVPNYYGGVYFIAPGAIRPFFRVTDPETPNFYVEALATGDTGSSGEKTIFEKTPLDEGNSDGWVTLSLSEYDHDTLEEIDTVTIAISDTPGTGVVTIGEDASASVTSESSEETIATDLYDALGVVEGVATVDGFEYTVEKLGAVLTFTAILKGVQVFPAVESTAANVTATKNQVQAGASVSWYKIVSSELPADYSVDMFDAKHVTIRYPGANTVGAEDIVLNCVVSGTGWDIETELGCKVGTINKTSRVIEITGPAGAEYQTNDADAEALDWNGTNTAMLAYITSNEASLLPAGFELGWVLDVSSNVLMTLYQTSPKAISTGFIVSKVNVYPYILNGAEVLPGGQEVDTIAISASGTPGSGTVKITGTDITINVTSQSTAATVTTALYDALIAAGGMIDGFEYSVEKTTSTLITLTSVLKGERTKVAAPVTGSYVTTAVIQETEGFDGQPDGSLDNPMYNTVTFSYRERAYGSVDRVREFTVSPNYYKVDGFNSRLYVEEVLNGEYFVNGKAYGDFDVSQSDFWAEVITPTNPYDISVEGYRAITDSSITSGEIGAANVSKILLEGWAKAKLPEFSDIDLFIDPEANDTVKTEFATMRSLKGSKIMFATYISGLRTGIPMSETAAQQIATYRNLYLPKIKGLAFYCNEFFVQEGAYKFWTVPVGAVGAMLCRIMDVKLGGFAPMFVNTSEGLGGQIASSVLKQKYNFSADDLQDLDEASINPIILDSTYGLMITSQRTAQDGAMRTDWSYLGHQMSFDIFRKEVRDNVMIPQIGKPIDATYMRMRREQTQVLLNKRLVGATAIWNSGKVLVEEVNTPETKLQNKFVIKVRVKVNPFSEFVELIFNNISQLATV